MRFWNKKTQLFFFVIHTPCDILSQSPIKPLNTYIYMAFLSKPNLSSNLIIQAPSSESLNPNPQCNKKVTFEKRMEALDITK